MSTDDSKPATPTPAEVAHARVTQWCAFAGITPERLAAVIAEVRALPGVAAYAKLRCDWRIGRYPDGMQGRPEWSAVASPVERLVVTLEVRSPTLTYPLRTGYHLFEIAGFAARGRGGLELLAECLLDYADVLDKATRASVAVPLRAADRKAERDREVADARAAAEGVRAIAARLRAELDGVQS